MEWQPIETAPKDGTQVLLYPKDGDGDICTGRWAKWRDGSAGWAAGGGWFEADEVSHWAPLPEAPASSGRGLTLHPATQAVLDGWKKEGKKKNVAR